MDLLPTHHMNNPRAGDAVFSLVLLGALGFGGFWLLKNWDMITKKPGWQCNHPVTPAGGTVGLTYSAERCCWFDSTGRCIYLADGKPF